VWASALVGVVALSTAVTAGAIPAGAATTKPEINTLLIATLQSALISRPHALDGAKAAAASILKKHGVKINVDSCNDGNDANLSAACGRQAATNHVDAVIGGLATQNPATYPALEAAKIPFFGNTPLADADFQSPIAFPFQPGVTPGAVAAALFAQKKACKKVAVLAGDPPASQAIGDFFIKTAKVLKLDVTTKVTVPAAAPDLAPYVAQALDSNPDCLNFSGIVGATRAVLAVRQSTKPTIPIIAGAATVTKQARDALGAALNGMFVHDQNIISEDPSLTQFHADMAAYSSDQTLVDDDALYGWANVYAVYQASQNVKGDLTSAKLLAAANKTTFNLEGFPKPIDFSAKSPLASAPRLRNTWLMHYDVQNGQLIQDGGPVDTRALLKKVSKQG
jgi:hypothetical protein